MTQANRKPSLSSSMAASDDGRRWFDEELADRYELFFPTLIKITEGPLAGQPMELIPCWRDALREVFGWRATSDDRRWYRTLYVYIPRKNAKTTTIAGIVLAIPIIEPEAKGQIWIAASTEKQAAIMFKMAQDFIAADKEDNGGTGVLESLYHVAADYIEHIPTGTQIKFMSGTKIGKTGSNPSVMIIDEFQEQSDLGLLARLKTGSSARKQPLVIIIGTAGENDDSEEVPWLNELKKAKAILENPNKAPRYLPMIYEAQEDDDPNDPAVWYKANPGLGIAQDFESFAASWDEMKDDPALRAFFLQYHLNIRRKVASEYVDMTEWLAAADPELTADKLRGQLCYGGLDLGLSSDMCAFHLNFPKWQVVDAIDPNGRKIKVNHCTHRVKTWYWTTRTAIEKSEKSTINYRPWVEAGWMEQAGDKVYDYALIRKRIVDICKKYGFKVQEIGYDRYQASEMHSNLTKVDKLKCVQVAQIHSVMNAPTVDWKNLVTSGDIVHDGNPVFVQNLRNVRVLTDTKGNQMISKKHAKGKIDGLAAALIAYRVFKDAPPPKPPLKIYSV